MTDDWYQAWIEQRRAAVPPAALPDRVMQLVMQDQTREAEAVALRIASWVDRSRIARCITCAAAMLIGCTPFVAYFALLLSV